MSVELTRDDGERFDFTNSAWFRLLEFARLYGWRAPAGLDCLNRLSAVEAIELAEAVARGVGDGAPELIAQRMSSELTRALVLPTDSATVADDPIEISARTVSYWRAFVDFALGGGFVIA
jgi:hypothetical protein